MHAEDFNFLFADQIHCPKEFFIGRRGIRISLPMFKNGGWAIGWLFVFKIMLSIEQMFLNTKFFSIFILNI